jgi:superfamily I DNA/RNA helicase
LFASIDFIAGKKRIRYKVDDELSNAAIRSASVYRFKGLEAKIIVLTDLHDLRSEEGRMAAYVGMSRATSALYVLLSHQAYTQFEANRLDFADTVDPRPIG